MKTNIKMVIATILMAFGIQALAATTVRVSIPAYDPAVKTVFNAAVKDYEKLNPGVKISLEVGSWTTWEQKLRTDFFSGNNADIIFSTRAWLPTYVGADKLEDFSNYLSKEDLSVFIPSLLDGAKVNGKQYGLPSVTSARNLYVNIDLLRKAGASVPKTWAQLRQVAKLVSEKTDAYGFGIQGKEVETDKYFYYALWNFGGSVMDKVIDGKKSTLDSKESIAAAEFYQDLIKSGYTQKNVTAYSRENLQTLFKQGKLAMMITHGVMGQEMESSADNAVNFVQTDVPGLNTRMRGNTLGVIDAVHLSKNSKVKKEAVKFLMFTFKPKYQAEWVGKSGLLPVTFAAAEDKIFQKSPLQAMISAVPNAKFALINSKAAKISSILTAELQSMYSGKKTAKQAMTDATNRINRAVR